MTRRAEPSGPSRRRSGPPSAEDVLQAGLREQLDTFLDEHRAALAACLDGLTEEQARRRLVPSATTLLGLVKHAVFVERVWFEEAVTGRSRAELGLEAGPDASFVLTADDTVASVRAAHAAACDASRRAVADLGLDDLLTGNRRGPLPLRWVLLHVLRELAQHCGHAEVLREQVLAAGAGSIRGPDVRGCHPNGSTRDQGPGAGDRWTGG